MADLRRLEDARAQLATDKSEAIAVARRQATRIETLRRALRDEQPRARARVAARREHERMHLRRVSELERQRVATRHAHAMTLRRAELEATRRRLAEVEALPVVERPGQRLLEWSMPVVAAGVLAVFGALMFQENTAIADLDRPDAITSATLAEDLPQSPDSGFVYTPPPAPEPVAVADPEPEPSAETETKKKAKKKAKKKNTKTKTKNANNDSGETTTTKRNDERKDPLKLGDFDGNPL